jgi:Na+-transporting NADH:ubiquinone oxidoreductase subunit NqrE
VDAEAFSSLGQALALTAETYRRSLWNELDVYVEIWLEKDALAGVLYDVTREWTFRSW